MRSFLFFDLLTMIACIIGLVSNYKKDWTDFLIFAILLLHSISFAFSHFRRIFINKWSE